MGKTITTVIISVICTLLVVAGVAAVALPKVIDQAKTAAVTNFDDEYQEIAYILDESFDPVIQPNYMITGLIMSPDFQEYLDQGVQNGWWTEEFLEQFLIDEALPIFFTNYHVLFSVLLGSDPVQDAGQKLTIIKSKVQSIVLAIKGKIGVLSGLLNSPTVANLKAAIGTLEANKETILGLIATLQSLDVDHINDVVSQLKGGLAELQDVIDTLKAIDFSNIKDTLANVEDNLGSVVATLEDVIAKIQAIDTDSIEQTIATLKDVVAQLQAIDKDELQATIEKLTAVIETIKGLDFDAIEELVVNLKALIEKIENEGFDGILQDVLSNVLESDAIQNILSQLGGLESTLENLLKVLNIYITKFVDFDSDYNFFEPITIGDKEVDLSDYARLLNVVDVYIPEDGYAYDNGGTPAKPGDDTVTITKLYLGFEIDGQATTNVLSGPVTITGSNAFALNTLGLDKVIGQINNLI